MASDMVERRFLNIQAAVLQAFARIDFERQGICSADLAECRDMNFCGECGKRGATDPNNDLCSTCSAALQESSHVR